MATSLSSSQSLPCHLLTLSPKFRVSISQNSSIHLFLLPKSLEGSGNTALAVEMLEVFMLAESLSLKTYQFDIMKSVMKYSV